MQEFTQEVRSFLEIAPPLARIGTVGPDGTPRVAPVEWQLGVEGDVIEVICPQRVSAAEDVARSGSAGLMIDDGQPAPHTRGVEIRGRAAQEGPAGRIVVRPDHILTWGLEGAGASGGSEEAPPASRLLGVVRSASYDPARVANAGERIRQFEQVHAAQPGYAGNAVVDLGDGERIMITLWKSRDHAAAARAALGPVIQKLLRPLERAPSRLLGVGDVITTDLVLASPKTP